MGEEAGGMTLADIPDDGFRVTEIGAYRWRVNELHAAKAAREIRQRWKRESEAKAA